MIAFYIVIIIEILLKCSKNIFRIVSVYHISLQTSTCMHAQKTYSAVTYKLLPNCNFWQNFFGIVYWLSFIGCVSSCCAKIRACGGLVQLCRLLAVATTDKLLENVCLALKNIADDNSQNCIYIKVSFCIRVKHASIFIVIWQNVILGWICLSVRALYVCLELHQKIRIPIVTVGTILIM